MGILLAGTSAWAQQDPPGCNANNLNIGISKSTTSIANGDTVTYIITFNNTATPGSGCSLVATGRVFFMCPAADGTASGLPTQLYPPGFVFPVPFTETFTQACAVSVNPAVGVAQAGVFGHGVFLRDIGTNGCTVGTLGCGDPANIDKTVSVLVFNPCVGITKSCSPGSCENGVIGYSGVIGNCGDEPITNIVLVHTEEGIATTNKFTNVLSPGGTLSYSGSYVASGTPSMDTVNVTAVGQITATTLAASTNATCELSGSPSLSLSFNCANAAGPGLPIQVNGTVSNNGPVTVSNVVISDSQNGALGGPLSLAPGQTAVVHTNFVPTDCSDTSDSIFVSGNGPARCGSVAVAKTNTVTCSILFGPGIGVKKSVTCPTDPWDPTIGVSAVVSNSGNDTLTGMTVVDNQAGTLSGATSLAAGATATYTGSYLPSAFPAPDTVTASGQGQVNCDGSNVTVTAQDNASCNPHWTPCLSVTKNNLCPTNSGDPIVFSGIVSNCGDVAIHDLVVTDNQVGAVTNLSVLGIGEALAYTGSYVPIGLPSSNTVTAVGRVPGIIYNQPGTTNISASASALCDAPHGECVTRTPGYWFNHLKSTDPTCATLKQAIQANGGRLDLGFICLPTNGVANAETAMRQALSFFPPDSKGLTPLCAARKKLAFHLIAAIANSALFGTDPAACVNSNGSPLPSDLIAMAQQIAACGNVSAITGVTSLLDSFNNSGDNTPMPAPLKPCGLGGDKNRDALRINVFNSSNCGNTNHCVSGHACP